MEQSSTPLFDQLTRHHERKPISFHVPGHKFGEVFSEKGNSFFADILKLDATEIAGLDDLHSPEGVILEAEKLLADLYRTKKSFFLINGSTVGNLAMIMSTIKEDDIVLVQRNSHKSIMNGIKLAKGKPVFISPEYHLDYGVAGGVSLDAVGAAITQYPDARALILTYPNYYGMTYDLESIIDLAHNHHIPVLVDEAHGVHFIAGNYFPPSAVELGADIVVQSAHKTLPAMTMGAFLHYQSKLVSHSHLQFHLQALQSSSPSYPLMASLDLARSYLGTYNSEDLAYLQKEIEGFSSIVNNIDTIRVLTNSDPLKISVQAAGSWTGFDLQKRLESEGVFTELADPYNVLLVLPLLKKGMKHRLREAADKIAVVAKEIPKDEKRLEHMLINQKDVSTLAIDYTQMEQLDTEVVLLEDSPGRIIAESIIPYPPGVPLCLPGEALNKADLETILYLREKGAKIQGGEYLSAGKIKVFKGWGI
ncbi:MAG TPA: arginine decarboxylase [Bacillus bacterium]|nr:arginine decarboxylase [Bacillus sp. (in: firmicutes)]